MVGGGAGGGPGPQRVAADGDGLLGEDADRPEVDDGLALGGALLEEVAVEEFELAAGRALVVGVHLDDGGLHALVGHDDAAVVLEGGGGQWAVVLVALTVGEDGVADTDDEQDHERGTAEDQKGLVALGGALLPLPLFPEFLSGALARFTAHAFPCFRCC